MNDNPYICLFKCSLLKFKCKLFLFRIVRMFSNRGALTLYKEKELSCAKLDGWVEYSKSCRIFIKDNCPMLSWGVKSYLSLCQQLSYVRKVISRIKLKNIYTKRYVQLSIAYWHCCSIYISCISVCAEPQDLHI